MPKYKILNSIGSVVDELDADGPVEAMDIYRNKCDLLPSEIRRIGYTVEPTEPKPMVVVHIDPSTPKNGEVWQTKSGRMVLIVTRPNTSGDELGFIWFDDVDKELCYATLMDQLERNCNLTLTDWGVLMQATMLAFATPKLYITLS